MIIHFNKRFLLLAVWITLILLSSFLYHTTFLLYQNKTQNPVKPLDINTPVINIWKYRQSLVTNAFKHAWMGYYKYAFPHDELLPLTKSNSDWFGTALTAIDCLDTSLIMHQPEIYNIIREYVANDLKFDRPGDSNVFELTIRLLGGFLATFNMTNDTVFLTKAIELGDILLIAFDSPSKIPLTSVDFSTRKPIASPAASISEVTTLQLEFKYLTYLTKDPKYWNAAQNIMKIVFNENSHDGLVPVFISPISGKFVSKEIRLGSRADSYYEYLAKNYIQSNQTEQKYRYEWQKSVNGIRKHLLGVSSEKNLLFVGELPYGIGSSLNTKMDHLVCFLPGTLALAATNGRRMTDLKLNERQKQDIDLAEELTKSCFEMYAQTPTGLSPEIVFWKINSNSRNLITPKPRSPFQSTRINPITPSIALEFHKSYHDKSEHITTFSRHLLANEETEKSDFDIHTFDGHNLLRPETVESLFILYRITGKKIYREMGWKLFESFEKWCKINSGGYSSLDDVRIIPPTFRNKMESFFLGETLKYFYLLFEDDEYVIPLDKYVFNTEAHPLPVFEITDLELKKKLLWL